MKIASQIKKQNWLYLVVAITCNFQTSAYCQNEYHYQPYPTLLVHGFNATPVSTWGIRTAKIENNPNRLSTKLDNSDDKFKDKKGNESNPFAKKLMQCFDENGDITDKPSQLDYIDYYNYSGRLTEPNPTNKPIEEAGSYQVSRDQSLFCRSLLFL